MFTKQPRKTIGVWHINTAQTIIILIAIGCGYVVLSAYQQAHQPPPSLTLTAVAPKPDPKEARYMRLIQAWQAKMTQQQLTVTWPYHNLDYAVRIDLPDKVPITLAPWDAAAQAKVAGDAYQSFTSTRVNAHIANPKACIVHVFSDTGEEVSQANASGVVTSAEQSLGTG